MRRKKHHWSTALQQFSTSSLLNKQITTATCIPGLTIFYMCAAELDDFWF